MKKIETLFIGVALVVAVAVTGGVMWHRVMVDADTSVPVAGSRYGDFLAAQHALSINDFERAAEFSANLPTEYPAVANTKILAEFLSGRMPENADMLGKDKALHATLIYDAYLVQNDRWDDFYKQHKSDSGVLMAPLRIWGAVATNHTQDALKWIDDVPTSDAWKHFVRGQIYAEQGDIKKAATEFAAVGVDFMNLNDYMYIMSFYRAHDMADAARELHAEFTGRPGGMFMLDNDFAPDWSQYAGYKNALGFSLIQNVSHTQIMMYSDLAIVMLRIAQMTAPGIGVQSDVINYYVGQYFFNNGGDYQQYFKKIQRDSPFHPFAILKDAENNNDISSVRAVLREYPLFVPAMNYMVGHYASKGERRRALRILNGALNDERVSNLMHAFLLKSRAHIHYLFGDYSAAASDLHAASDVLGMDAEIMALQAKIWAAEKREIENAYQYAMTLVQHAPSDVLAWDTLGHVVAVREGPDAALDVLERVGGVANTCSSLFEHLGDLWAGRGETVRAKAAYNRALELADDGLVVIPHIEKKLRKLK